MPACPLCRSPAGLDLLAPRLLVLLLQSQGDADQLLQVGEAEEMQGPVPARAAHPGSKSITRLIQDRIRLQTS